MSKSFMSQRQVENRVEGLLLIPSPKQLWFKELCSNQDVGLGAASSEYI